jgi:hypothetical protein
MANAYDIAELAVEYIAITNGRKIPINVGIIGAQSISEPMTSMMLDAHHRPKQRPCRANMRIREILGATKNDISDVSDASKT